MAMEPVEAWLTLVGSFVNNIMAVVPQASFPVFYDHLVDKFDSTRAIIGGTQFVFFFTTSLGCILASPFIQKYGPRKTSIVGAVLLSAAFVLCSLAPRLWCFQIFFFVVGIGRSPLVLAAMVVVQQQFTTHRGMATAISCLGYYVSDTVTPIMTSYFVEHFGLSGAFLLIGAFTLHALPFSLLFNEFKSTLSKNTGRKVNSDFSINSLTSVTNGTDETVSIRKSLKILLDFSVFKNLSYSLLFILRFAQLAAKFTILGHGVSAASHVGFADQEAAFTASVFGFSCIVFVIICIVILGTKRCKTEILFALGNVFGLCASLMSLTAVIVEPNLLYVSMVFTGGFVGVGYCTLVLTTVMVVGVDKVNRAISLFELTLLPGAVIALPFGGWLIDLTGDFIAAFSMAVMFCVLATMISIIVACRVQTKNRKDKMVALTLANTDITETKKSEDV